MRQSKRHEKLQQQAYKSVGGMLHSRITFSRASGRRERCGGCHCVEAKLQAVESHAILTLGAFCNLC